MDKGDQLSHKSNQRNNFNSLLGVNQTIIGPKRLQFIYCLGILNVCLAVEVFPRYAAPIVGQAVHVSGPSILFSPEPRFDVCMYVCAYVCIVVEL